MMYDDEKQVTQSCLLSPTCGGRRYFRKVCVTASRVFNAAANSVEVAGWACVNADTHSCNTVAITSLIHTEVFGVEVLLRPAPLL